MSREASSQRRTARTHGRTEARELKLRLLLLDEVEGRLLRLRNMREHSSQPKIRVRALTSFLLALYAKAPSPPALTASSYVLGFQSSGV